MDFYHSVPSLLYVETKQKTRDSEASGADDVVGYDDDGDKFVLFELFFSRWKADLTTSTQMCLYMEHIT